jgi:2-dehydro-3-deoxy-L-rhamnonate dehydrogenase (NAD+)
MNSIDLDGQHAVVTGGAQGLGFAMARRFVASGATVTLWDLDEARLETAKKELGSAATTETVDVADWASVDAARARTEELAGKISILVNSAGIAGPAAPLDVYDIETWKKVIDVNVNGTFYVNRAVVPGMKERNYGRIVNIASVAGKEGNPNASAYSASKAGVIGLTKSLGKELATLGVIANSLTPATFESPILEQLPQSQVDYMRGKIPMGRLGEIHESAAMVCFMASEECSFTTGATFDTSGGRTTF